LEENRDKYLRASYISRPEYIRDQISRVFDQTAWMSKGINYLMDRKQNNAMKLPGVSKTILIRILYKILCSNLAEDWAVANASRFDPVESAKEGFSLFFTLEVITYIYFKCYDESFLNIKLGPGKKINLAFLFNTKDKVLARVRHFSEYGLVTVSEIDISFMKLFAERWRAID
jgi:hypothetical protein